MRTRPPQTRRTPSRSRPVSSTAALLISVCASLEVSFVLPQDNSRAARVERVGHALGGLAVKAHQQGAAFSDIVIQAPVVGACGFVGGVVLRLTTHCSQQG